MSAFTVKPARYAQGMMAVTPTDDCSGLKGRSARLAEYLKGRWTHREHAYILSPRKVEKLTKLYDEGYDSSPVLKELYKS